MYSTYSFGNLEACRNNHLAFGPYYCWAILLLDGVKMSKDLIEYFEFNVACAYVGPHTPIFVDTMDINGIRRLAIIRNNNGQG